MSIITPAAPEAHARHFMESREIGNESPPCAVPSGLARSINNLPAGPMWGFRLDDGRRWKRSSGPLVSGVAVSVVSIAYLRSITSYTVNEAGDLSVIAQLVVSPFGPWSPFAELGAAVDAR